MVLFGGNYLRVILINCMKCVCVCVCVFRMNPAAQPLPVQDVQGDARWISQVNGSVSHFYIIRTYFC